MKDYLKILKEVIIYFLIIFSATVILYFAYYFITRSPQFVTHEQLGGSMFAIGSAFFGGLFAFWLKLTDITKEIGEIKGTLNQFIKNHK